MFVLSGECNSEFHDIYVEPNKTYYYMTFVEGSDSFGEVIKITTNSVIDLEESDTANENTNIYLDFQKVINLNSYVSWVLLFSAMIFIAYCTKKYVDEN